MFFDLFKAKKDDTAPDKEGRQAIVIGNGTETAAFSLPLSVRRKDALINDVARAKDFNGRLKIIEDAVDECIWGMQSSCFIDENGKINPSTSLQVAETGLTAGIFYEDNVFMVALSGMKKPQIFGKPVPAFCLENETIGKKRDKLKALYKKNKVALTPAFGQDFAEKGFAIYPAYTF